MQVESSIALLNALKLLCVVQDTIFLALNAYDYQLCYPIFTLILKISQSMYSGVNENEEIVSVEFCTYVKIKILREKNA